MAESNAVKRRFFGCAAYKIVAIILLLTIIAMFFYFIMQIKILGDTFETAAPYLEQNIIKKIDVSTQAVLKQLAINDKTYAQNSEIVLHKAKLLEYLRAVSEAKAALSDGTISEEKLEIFDTIANDKIIKESNQLKRFVIRSIPSDEEIAIALLDNMKLSTTISLLSTSPQQLQNTQTETVFNKLKARGKDYLSRLINIQPISESNTVIKGGKSSYQPEDLAYFIIKNGEYKILLEVLNKQTLSAEVESLLNIIQLKSEIKEHLIQIEKLLLE